MLFKKEVASVCSLSESNNIVDLLYNNGINAYVKSIDNFTGGILENRRSLGSLGMDFQFRYIYKIYVKNTDYEMAKKILG